MNLNARTVAALRMPTGKTDVIYFDDTLSGFGFRLRAGAGGKLLRSWVTQYRRAGGTRRITLGPAGVLNAEQARLAARKVLAAAALGQDPQAERIDRRGKDQHSFRSIAKEYLQAKESAVRRRTFVESTRYLTGKYFKPLHAMPIDVIGRKDVAARLVAIGRENGSVTASRARTAVNTFFVWTMQMGYVEANPVIGTIQPQDSKVRSRVLSDTELATVWRACGDDDYGKIVRLLILTGARRQEVGGMRWSELDAERSVWTIPAERAKNKRPHSLPLAAAAWQIIDGVPRVAHRDYLFGIRAQGYGNWAEGKVALDKAVGDSVAPFVVHDIRRTVATRMADLGVQPHIIEQVLNHQSGHKAGPAGIYNRSPYTREVTATLALWADHVRSLAEGGERKIVAFTDAAAS
jgi:integrase